MVTETPYRVLVIDDEQVVLDAVLRLLSADGYEVITALDAETGLELVRSDNPDLAVVDLKLPGMSGLDFLDATNAGDTRPVVILTTGVSGADQAVAALNHGAFDFLPKPFTYEELMSSVLRATRYLDLGESEDESMSKKGDSNLFQLGSLAWARPEDNRIVRVGVTDLFQCTTGEVLEVVSSGIDAEIRQGGVLARVRTIDNRWHVALAAASGRVAEVNVALLDSPQLLNQDPFGRGWLAAMQSANFHRDLQNLRRTET